jgi:hypothetical protein
VKGFLVPTGVRGCPVDLHEHESGRVVVLLDDIETGYARFLDAVAGIVQGSLLEIRDAIRSDVNEDVNDQHGVTPHCKPVTVP